MNEFDYKGFYDTVGKINGWDFSKLTCTTEGVKWDFYNEVAQACRKSDVLLDIGTGGGEALLSIADSALFLVGVDLSTGMIETATRNLSKSNKSNIRFFQMDAERLEFPEGFFHVVSCRHSAFCAKEIARVLAKDGIFLTQQVGESDKLNLKEAFRRGQAFEARKGALMRQYMVELNEAGFTDVQLFEYNATEYYKTPNDLIFLLKYTPIIPDFGQTERDFHILQQFIEDHQTEKGIKTNSNRFMIKARLK